MQRHDQQEESHLFPKACVKSEFSKSRVSSFESVHVGHACPAAHVEALPNSEAQHSDSNSNNDDRNGNSNSNSSSKTQSSDYSN